MIRAKVSNETLPESGVTQGPVAPTYAPFLLALGITMIFWGIVTSWVMSFGGLVLFVWALWLWIGAIAHGWRQSDAHPR